MRKRYKKIILLLGDIAVLYLSLYLTLLIRYQAQPDPARWQLHFWPFTAAFVVWLVIFYISDLYNLHLAVNNSRFFSLTLRSVFIAGLLSAAFFYANPKINIAPKTNLAIYLVVFFLLFIGWRRLFNWSLNTYLPKNNIAVIGYNKGVSELIGTLEEKPHLGYKIKLIASNLISEGVNDIVIINKLGELKDKISELKIATVVMAVDPHQSETLRSVLFSLLPLKLNFTNLPNLYEQVTGKVPIESIGKMWFLENLTEGNKIWYDRFKRAYDILIALAILAVTAVFWPLIAALIKLESPGPVFYKSVRMGKNNQEFKLIKFRTMREEDNMRTLTLKKDPRITRFGSFLRKTRIDEIPQVLNVLANDMSFIGPRPERPEFTGKLEAEIPFYRERMLVKPGATGWDQVSGEYHSPTLEDTMKKLQYDLYYIKNRSLYLDISIVLKTIATIFRRGGV